MSKSKGNPSGTSALRSWFEEGERPAVVFDLNSLTRGQRRVAIRAARAFTLRCFVLNVRCRQKVLTCHLDCKSQRPNPVRLKTAEEKLTSAIKAALTEHREMVEYQAAHFPRQRHHEPTVRRVSAGVSS